MSFLGGVWDWFTGNSITSSIAKTALLGYSSRLLNESTSSDKSDLEPAVDPGVRIQLNPSTDTKIPILYGDGYFGGSITDAAISTDLKTMHYVITLAEITGTKYSNSSATGYTFHNVYLNSNRVEFKADGVTVDYTVDTGGNQDTSMRDLVKVYMYAHDPLQPDGEVGTTPAAHTLISHWDDTNYPMTGLMYAIVEVNYNQSKGVTNLPNTLFHMESDMTLPGDVLYDYMTDDVYGAGIPVAEIDTDSITAINAYANAGFTYTDADAIGQSGVVDINGLIDTKTQCLRNMEEICESINSWLSYDIHNGQWTIIINDVSFPVAIFTDSNIIGEIGVTGTSLTQLFNKVDVKYQNTDIKDKTDFVKIETPVGDLYDNEPETTLNLDMPFTNKQAVAMKVGLIALNQARMDKIIKFDADYSYINIKAGEVITVTSPGVAMSSKLFRVITVREVEGNLGDIQVEITALEYFTSVYDYDITELSIETDDGILTIGAIGKPIIHDWDKNDQGNLPHIIVKTKVPSGIVDVMELWLTYDTTVPNDVDRTYIPIGQQSNTNGDQFTEDDLITFQYNNLSTGDFFVKVRGRNAMTTGPYSDPSGLIEYVPVVIADTVSDDPVDFGGSLMGLGLLTLLNNLDTLLDIFNGEKSIEDAIKEILFPGSDPSDVETAAEALLNDETFISSMGSSISLESLSDTATDLALEDDFLMYDGTNWIPTDVVPGGGANIIDELGDVDTTTVTPNAEDILVWDGVNWVPRPGCCDIELEVCEVTISTKSANTALTGDHVITYTNAEGGLAVNSGNIYLYKSDGTLVETKTAAQCSFDEYTITIPASTKDACTDYYILMDRGIGKDCNGCLTPRICLSSTWAWTTVNDDLPTVTSVPYDPGTPAPSDPSVDAPWVPPGPAIPQPIASDGSCTATFTGRSDRTEITFNQEVKPGQGQLHITDASGTVHSFESCEIFADTGITWTEDGYTTTGVIPSYLTTPVDTGGGGTNGKYTFTKDSDFVTGRLPECPDVATAITFTPTTYNESELQGPSDAGRSGNFTSASSYYEVETHGPAAVGTGSAQIINRDTGAVLSTADATTDGTFIDADSLEVIMQNPAGSSSFPLNGATEIGRGTDITIAFNKNIVPQTGNFYLYKGATLVQTFDITTKFTDDFTSGIIGISDDYVYLNPTECLEPETVYHIRADANVVVSVCQEQFAGITDASILSFTTISKVTPTLDFVSLAPNSNQSVNETGVVIDAPGTLAPGSGDVRVYDENDNLLDTITAGDSRVTITED